MILTEEHQMIRDALRTFSQERLAPNAARWDKEHYFPKAELKELAALGAFGVAVPEELGGAGLDYVSLALVLEEIAAGDGGTSTIISVNNCPVCSIAMMYANDAQKAQWLRPLAQGDMLGDVERHGRLPHRGAGGDDEEVARVHPAGHFIEFEEPGANALDALARVEKGL